MALTSLKHTIQQKASQCVKCGLCLPHCPTYQLTGNEGESPRGRIALMDGLARDQLTPSSKLQSYLNHCLTCRACEAVCPAQVQYGQLIDDTRAYLLSQTQSTAKPPRIPWWIRSFVLAPSTRRLIRSLLATTPTWLQRLCAPKYAPYLPKIKHNQRWRGFYPALTPEQGRVALFIGCISDLLAQEITAAAIKVLNYCGYGVYLPRSQSCCGALHLHSGDQAKATQYQATNLASFADLKITAIITTASGCAATLKEYKNFSAQGEQFSCQIMDISQFLAQITWPSQLHFKPLSEVVALHTPCSLNNVLQQAAAPKHLLERIPAIKLVTLAATGQCCGAAGLYMLQQPEFAQRLAQKLVGEIKLIQPRYFLTSNIGCSLHLRKALNTSDNFIQLLHPIQLLAQQLTY